MIQVLSFIYIHLFNDHKILEVDSNILLVLQIWNSGTEMLYNFPNITQLGFKSKLEFKTKSGFTVQTIYHYALLKSSLEVYIGPKEAGI